MSQRMPQCVLSLNVQHTHTCTAFCKPFKNAHSHTISFFNTGRCGSSRRAIRSSQTQQHELRICGERILVAGGRAAGGNPIAGRW